MDNPLLARVGLPAYHQVQPEHAAPALKQVLQEAETILSQLEADRQGTWRALRAGLERIDDLFQRSWAVVNHLLMVRSSDALRQAHAALQPQVVAFNLRQAQSPALYARMRFLLGREPDPLAQRILQQHILSAEQAGVGLRGAARERFNALAAELAENSTKFSHHVLDATKAWSHTLREASTVAGLPDTWRAMAAHAAAAEGETGATAEQGPWRITLDYPSFGPVLEYADQRSLREIVYRAYIQRAGSDPYNNTPVLCRILAIRREQAQLLGRPSYAALSLESKMAQTVSTVDALLERLRSAALPAAKRDHSELQAYAAAKGHVGPLEVWDIGYWAERQRQERYAFSSEELRPYLPLPRVLNGLFALIDELFGVQLQALPEGQMPVWHADVRCFSVSRNGTVIAQLYLDPYARSEDKRGGAWMDVCLPRRVLEDGSVQLPVAILVCNQMPPVGNTPSLMSLDEVETLFHEMGHGLQHVLTQVDTSLVSGISGVEWDAVELPSQFLEQFSVEAKTLGGMASHVETGAALPEGLIERIHAAQTYRAAWARLRQVHLSLLDLRLHELADPTPEAVAALRARLVPSTTVVPPLPEDCFLCGFGHVFSGGYAAGYYSYQWADVLAADAFALVSQGDRKILGRRFAQTVLALGGSVHPSSVFQQFAGRDPDPDALLRRDGLLAAPC